MEWNVEVTDEAALRDYVRRLVGDRLAPHDLAGEVADANAADVVRALMELASNQLLRGTAEVPGLGASQLVSRPDA
jgi:hypothetical protein